MENMSQSVKDSRADAQTLRDALGSVIEPDWSGLSSSSPYDAYWSAAWAARVAFRVVPGLR